MVYLVQHGKSYPKDVDPERRLSEEGVRETESVARKARALGVKVREIWHSGKARARMTAEIFAEYLGVDEVIKKDNLAPLDDPTPVYKELSGIKYDVLIVGHLPHLSKLLSMLLHIDTEVVKFSYSHLLALEKEESGKYYIKWYLPP